jgi:hypothetical protein
MRFAPIVSIALLVSCTPAKGPDGTPQSTATQPTARADVPSATSGEAATPAAGEELPAVKTTGVKECDEYLSVFERCAAKAPPDAKEATVLALKDAKANYQNIPEDRKAEAQKACRTERDSLLEKAHCR